MSKYKRIAELYKNPIQEPKTDPKNLHKSMTIPNQAMSLKDVVQRSISGFPVPMQRQEIQLPDDVNQLLQGTRYDVVSDAKFRKMSKIERQRYINNLQGLNQGMKQKLDKAIANKKAQDLELSQTAQMQDATTKVTE